MKGKGVRCPQVIGGQGIDQQDDPLVVGGPGSFIIKFPGTDPVGHCR